MDNGNIYGNEVLVLMVLAFNNYDCKDGSMVISNYCDDKQCDCDYDSGDQGRIFWVQGSEHP